MAQTFVDWAQSYATRGWRVIPDHSIADGECTCRKGAACPHPGKHPRLLNWTAQASTDRSVIEEWWTTWPQSNIAILTGPESGIVVLDIDPRHGGLESLRLLEQQHGPLSDTAVVETGGGGLHYYFAYPPGGEVHSLTVAPGVELKAIGGKVTVPPSLHASGQCYTWVSDKDPPPLPPWLLPEKKKARSHKPKPGLSGVPEGQRDIELFRYACALRAKGTSREEAEALVLAKAAACDPPLPPEVAGEKLRSAWKYFPAEEGKRLATLLQQDPKPSINEYGDYTFTWEESLVTIKLTGLVETVEGVDAELSVFIRTHENAELRIIHGPVRFHLLSHSAREGVGRYLRKRYPRVSDWEHYLETAARESVAKLREGDPVLDLQNYRQNGHSPWLFSPFLLENLPTVLYADGGTGKSTFALAVQLAVQTGNANILHIHPPSRPRTGLYLDWETSGEGHGHRMDRILKGAGITYSGTVPYVRCVGPLHSQVAQIKQKAQKIGAEFLIVDSVALAAAGEPKDATTALQFFGALSRIGLPSLCIAHRPRGGQNIFGSVFFRNSARSVWSLRAEYLEKEGTRLTFFHEKSNIGAPVPGFTYTIHWEAETIQFLPGEGKIFQEALPPLLPSLTQRIHEVFHTSGQATQEELACKLGVHLEEISRALSADMETERRPGGYYFFA